MAGTIVLYGFAMVMIAWTFLLRSQPTALPDTTRPTRVREAEWETKCGPLPGHQLKSRTAFLGVSKDGKIWVDVFDRIPSKRYLSDCRMVITGGAFAVTPK